MKNRLLLLLIIPLFLVGCQDDDDLLARPLQGVYTGVFIKINVDQSTLTRPVSITFNGSNYQSSNHPDRIPAGGSGSFEEGISVISFNDINLWTADFDQNLILNGAYNISSRGTNSIFFVKSVASQSYIYQVSKE